MEPSLFDPVVVVEAQNITINEYFGNVASKQEELSMCIVTVRGASEEAYQCPEFDEYVIVLEGKVILEYGEQGKAAKSVTVAAGQGAFLPKGLRVKWIWPGPCRYIPVCTPAFTPSNCGREEESGNHLAKTSDAMMKLRQLHAESQHPYLLHVALKQEWECVKGTNTEYFPPTYSADGFIHATSDPSKLVDVLNHFYRDVKGEWVCLVMTAKSLRDQGTRVVFEAPADVGDTKAMKDDDTLFPHIYGGIKKSTVLRELPVLRASDGTFLSIPGADNAGSVDSNAAAALTTGAKYSAMAAAGGVSVGLLFGIAIGVVLSKRR